MPNCSCCDSTEGRHRRNPYWLCSLCARALTPEEVRTLAISRHRKALGLEEEDAEDEAAPRPVTERYLEVRESLPEELRPKLDVFREDYEQAAYSRTGRYWRNYEVFADMVRRGYHKD